MNDSGKQKSKFELLAIIFLVGFSSLIYEIYSIKVLFTFFVETTQAASVAISSFLAGIAASAIIFSKIADKKKNNLRIIFYLQIVSAFYGYFVISNYSIIPSLVDNIEISSQALVSFYKATSIWLFLFIPAFFLGGAFPLINGLYLDDLDHTTKQTGSVYFWDSFGAILGALATGFIFLPYLGLNYTVAIAILVNLVCCLFSAANKFYEKIAFSLIAIMALIFAAENMGLLDKKINPLENRFGEILFQEESSFGRITIGDLGSRKGLFINYRHMCLARESEDGDNIGKIAAQNLKPNSKVLNIGLGCGFTAANLAASPNVAELDIIEINPIIIKASRLHFAKETNGVFEKENVNIIQAEGYEYLRNSDKKYDAIIVDIEEPTIIHSSALYTKEFFDVANSRLNEDGLFGIWSFRANTRFTKVLYNTISTTYDNVYILTMMGENLFFGSQKKRDKLDNGQLKSYIATVMKEDVSDIETIESNNLQKYYDLNQVFSLPGNYRDDYEK